MSLILTIDTAVEGASVCLAREGDVVACQENPSQKDSAAWIQPALHELVKEYGITWQHLDAIAVSAGPGSYTGLRVGMSTAKGLCYALGIPLITIGTLKMMALAALDEDADLLCPMIDARRMEVFTALYNKQLEEVVAPHSLILTPGSFGELVAKHRVVFFGNGSPKFAPLAQHPNARFATLASSARHLAPLAHKQFTHKAFADLAYAEPYYGKEFFSPYFKSNT